MKLGRIMIGPSDALGDDERLVDASREARFRNREADVGHRALEEVTVLGGGDGVGTSADHLDAERSVTPRARVPSSG